MYPAHPTAEVGVGPVMPQRQQYQPKVVNWPVVMGKNSERVANQEVTVWGVLVEERRNLILFSGGSDSSRISGSLVRLDLCLLGPVSVSVSSCSVVEWCARPTVTGGQPTVSLSDGGTTVDLELALDFALELVVGADERAWRDVSPLSPSPRVGSNLAEV